MATTAETDAAGPSTAPSPPLEKLFHTERAPTQLALICLYFPLGIILAIMRFFICLHALLVTLLLPKTCVIRSYVLRVMCTVLGLVVVEDEKNKDPDVRVIVANHVSVVDHWMLDILQPCVLPSVWDLPCVLNWGYIYKEFDSPTHPNVVAMKSFLEKEKPTLLCFPEKDITNGTVGLMKFSQTWPFELGTPVQAVAIKASRTPFHDLSLSTLESSWFSDLMWLLFSPWTTFRVSRLPAVSRAQGESVRAFSKRVAEMLASQLGVAVTSHTPEDITDMLKRRQVEQLQSQIRAQEAQARSNPRLLQMAYKVKEVLPDVPLHVILQDLQLTTNIDTTISRIVDGVVRYVPEKQTPVQTKSETTPSTQDVALDYLLENAVNAEISFNTAASSFGSTAKERFLSYKERKARLLENARLRYIQKHGLKL